MTIEKLSKYFYLSKDIEKIRNELQELEETLISSSQMTGMPHGQSVSSPTEQRALKIVALKDLLNEKLNTQLDESIMIEKFINEIKDWEVKLIVRMRFKELQEWYPIGKELHCDRSTAYYKLKRYLELVNQKEVAKSAN